MRSDVVHPDTAKIRANAYIRKLAALCLMLLTIIAQTGCAGNTPAAADPVTGENYYLDTVCSIAVYAMKDADGAVKPAADLQEQAESAIDDAFKLCAQLDKTLSRTQEASDISRINNAGGDWTKVSDYTIDIIHKGMEYSYTADGAFDITVGGLTELWDFHADPEDAAVPDSDALAEAAKHVNYRFLAIEGNDVRLTDPKSKLDLGGIAKGYIGDRMTEVLEDDGVVSAVINLGGNVICIGGKTDTDDFVIGVEAPYSDRTEIVGKINARDKTLVTSGIYERQIEVDGKQYHHILDTKTGWPVETDLDAVTLVADKGRSGDIDALSTICLIKGSEAAKDFIENNCDGVEAVFVLHDGSIDKTSGMEFEPID